MMKHATGHRYLIALGSNRRHVRHGAPRDVLAKALRRLGRHDVKVEAVSRTISSAPIGPSQRRFANAVALVETERAPDAMLALCKRIERKFGRRRGRRWGSRVIDLDIILWSGGIWTSQTPSLAIPHPGFRGRDFVLGPAAAIARDWRDPLTGLTIGQLHARLRRPRPAMPPQAA